MDKKANIPILILAAGASKRMGKPIKQILSWKETTLVENAFAQARASQFEDVFVVLGAHKKTIKKETKLPDNSCIYNEEWSTGMGSSIVAGMNYILSLEKRYDGVLIMLADQPFIDAEYLNELLGIWSSNAEATITATRYKNGLGVPALFGKCHFKALLKLTNTYGARDIINTHKVTSLNPKGKETDIDTWQDYQKMID